MQSIGNYATQKLYKYCNTFKRIRLDTCTWRSFNFAQNAPRVGGKNLLLDAVQNACIFHSSTSSSSVSSRLRDKFIHNLRITFLSLASFVLKSRFCSIPTLNLFPFAHHVANVARSLLFSWWHTAVFRDGYALARRLSSVHLICI